MGIIKEPLEIDFEVENRDLTKEEEKLISNFIKAEKEKMLLKQTKAKSKTRSIKFTKNKLSGKCVTKR